MIADLRNSNVIPFIYPVDITLSSNGSGSKNLTLAADSWFELRAFRGVTNATNAATDQNPNYFSCQVIDAGTGRALQSTRVQQAVLCGNAFRGEEEKRAIKFAPNTVLQFDFLNLTSSSLTVQLALVGYKWFNLPNS